MFVYKFKFVFIRLILCLIHLRKKTSEKLNDDFNHRELFQSLVTFFFHFMPFSSPNQLVFKFMGVLTTIPLLSGYGRGAIGMTRKISDVPKIENKKKTFLLNWY